MTRPFALVLVSFAALVGYLHAMEWLNGPLCDPLPTCPAPLQGTNQ